MICAPNGAGKSVLRQAFGDLLFGIGGKSPMGFRFAYASMHLAASAVAADGPALAFGRRKGHGNTLTDERGRRSRAVAGGASGRDGPRRAGAAVRAGYGAAAAGRRPLMASGGLVADALLSAGGLGGAREARRALEEQADKLAPARRLAQRPFYVAADRFVAARRLAGEALLKPDAWDRQSREIALGEAALAAARGKAAEALAAMGRLQRLRRVRPALAALDAAAAWLNAHPDAPALPEALRGRLEEAGAALRASGEKRRAETLRLEALRAELGGVAEDAALLAQAAAIDVLAEHAGAVGKALEDLPGLEGELSQIEARIAARLRSLGAAGADAAALIPPRAVATGTRALIRGHGRHEQACQAAVRSRDALARQIAVQQALPAGASAETAALAALIEEVRAEGDPGARARDALARVREAEAALARALAETPFWSGDVPDFGLWRCRRRRWRRRRSRR